MGAAVGRGSQDIGWASGQDKGWGRGEMRHFHDHFHLGRWKGGSDHSGDGNSDL